MLFARPRDQRLTYRLLIFFVSVWIAAMGMAFAQPVSNIAQPYRTVDVYTAVALERLEILTGPASDLQLSTILAQQRDAFKPIAIGALVKDSSWESSLWVRLTLKPGDPQAATTASAQTFLEIPKPYLDNVAL